MDSYAQDSKTFYFHVRTQNKTKAFLKLLEKAHAEGKYIAHVSPFDDTVLYDDYFIEDLVLVDSLQKGRVQVLKNLF